MVREVLFCVACLAFFLVPLAQVCGCWVMGASCWVLGWRTWTSPSAVEACCDEVNGRTSTAISSCRTHLADSPADDVRNIMAPSGLPLQTT